MKRIGEKKMIDNNILLLISGIIGLYMTAKHQRGILQKLAALMCGIMTIILIYIIAEV